jgi:T5SS/PEP-CTERM-associated repeat protein
MATYNWTNASGGDFNDPHNWLNNSGYDGKIPGSSDTAVFQGFTEAFAVKLDGETVENLSVLCSVSFKGNLTVTDLVNGGDFLTGTLSAGTVENAAFDGASVIATAFDGCAFNSGSATADTLASGTIAGGTVDATVSAGGSFIVEQGTLTSASLALTDTEANISGSAANATFTGHSTMLNHGNVSCGGADLDFGTGGQLTFDAGLHIDDSQLWVYNKGAVEVKNLNATSGAGDASALVNLFAGGDLDVGNNFTFSASGANNNASVNVGDDAVMTIGNNFILAAGAGTTANVSIGDDDGSKLGADLGVGDDWIIGGAGTAVVDVAANSQIIVKKSVVLGQSAGGVGTLDLSGSANLFEVALDIEVGLGGSGTLEVENGAQISTDAAFIQIAAQPGSSGTLTLDDGSILLNTLTVGGNGAGVFNDIDAAYISVVETFEVGSAASGSGTVSLIDSSVGFDVSEEAVIGLASKGVVTSQDSTIDFRESTVVLGKQQGVKGRVVMNGGELRASGLVTIGKNGTGIVNLKSGALWTETEGEAFADVALGLHATATGTLNITGSNSAADFDDLIIGNLGQGVVNLISGGVLEVGLKEELTASDSTAGEVEIGSFAGSSGELTMTGSSVFSAIDLDIGGSATAAGGAATVNIGAGSTAVVYDAAVVWNTATVEDSGSLTITDGLTGNGAIRIESGGDLTLADAIDKTVNIRFAAEGTNETLTLHADALPTVALKGFASGDEVKVVDLGASDTISTSYSGSIATVTFLSGGTSVGQLSFAMATGLHDTFAFNASSGALTLASS